MPVYKKKQITILPPEHRGRLQAFFHSFFSLFCVCHIHKSIHIEEKKPFFLFVSVTIVIFLNETLTKDDTHNLLFNGWFITI
jgi:hypothetical protein